MKGNHYVLLMFINQCRFWWRKGGCIKTNNIQSGLEVVRVMFHLQFAFGTTMFVAGPWGLGHSMASQQLPHSDFHNKNFLSVPELCNLLSFLAMALNQLLYTVLFPDYFLKLHVNRKWNCVWIAQFHSLTGFTMPHKYVPLSCLNSQQVSDTSQTKIAHHKRILLHCESRLAVLEHIMWHAHQQLISVPLRPRQPTTEVWQCLKFFISFYLTFCLFVFYKSLIVTTAKMQ